MTMIMMMTIPCMYIHIHIHIQIHYDNQPWVKKGGVVNPELFDAILQVSLCMEGDEAAAVYYAGGFEAAHFLRQPATDVS